MITTSTGTPSLGGVLGVLRDDDDLVTICGDGVLKGDDGFVAVLSVLRDDDDLVTICGDGVLKGDNGFVATCGGCSCSSDSSDAGEGDNVIVGTADECSFPGVITEGFLVVVLPGTTIGRASGSVIGGGRPDGDRPLDNRVLLRLGIVPRGVPAAAVVQVSPISIPVCTTASEANWKRKTGCNGLALVCASARASFSLCRTFRVGWS